MAISGPVAPTRGSTSSDISEEVEELLVTLHSWVKPGMVFTVVGTAMPTMKTSISLAAVVVTPGLSTAFVEELYWEADASTGLVVFTPKYPEIPPDASWDALKVHV